MDKSNAAYMIAVTLTIISMITGAMLYWVLSNSIDTIRYFAAVKNSPRLIKKSLYDESHGPHSWTKTKLVLTGLEAGEYLVCLVCGRVSGTDLFLNDPGLEVLKNNILTKEREDTKVQRQIDRTQEILEADFNYWVKTNLQQFSNDPEKNKDLLRKFSVFTVGSVNDAAKRAIRETE